MSKILYIVDNRENKDYEYNIEEDTIIYHFVIDSSSKVVVKLIKEGVRLDYYYSNINYQDNSLDFKVYNLADKTHAEIYNHGVNVLDNKLNFYVSGYVEKRATECICNQENQIINIQNGKSTICPNLLIDNYDVSSSHSAYIGKIKDELLFYLMSRGISKKMAYNLLLKGFLINTDSVNFEQIGTIVEEIEKI